jgi:hypothetical protein
VPPVRTMFWLYVAVIVVGLGVYLGIGLSG